MTEAANPQQAMHTFVCPNCNEFLAVEQPGTVVCANCLWRGDIDFFRQAGAEALPTEEAHGDDATCVHHATKKATATCAGSGDYICPLCTVEIEGKPYSLQYLEHAGAHVMEHQFQRYLPRPDSHIMIYVALVFFVPFTYLWLILSVVWLPHAYALYFSAIQLRKRNPLFREVVGRGRMIVLAVAIVAATIICAIYLLYLIRNATFFFRVG